MNTNMNTNIVNEPRTTISLSKENYEKLSRLGFVGESFNDVIGRPIVLHSEANKDKQEEDKD